MNALLNPQDDFTPHAIEDEKQQIYHASRSVIRPEITKVRASTSRYQLPLIGT
jgi:hypothetical protein